MALQISRIAVLGTKGDLERNRFGDLHLLVQSISSRVLIVRLVDS
jgi:hypothetical protein